MMSSKQRIVIKKDCFNDSFLKYLDDETINQYLFGGAGSGKSVFVARRAVLDIAMNDRNYLVARGTQRSIRSSTWNEVCAAISFLGLDSYFLQNKSELTITCVYSGCQFVFVGCDDTEKLKSIRPKIGVFTDLWCEEATEISAPANKQLRLRLRGRSDKTKRYIYTFNPIYITHWIYTSYFAPIGVPDDVREFRDKDTLIFRSTYRDNRFLDAQDIQELLSYKGGDPYWYQVYAEGKWGVLGHRVFRDWEIANLSGISQRNCYNGLDFGYANDPSALARSSIGNDNKELLVFTPEVGGKPSELYAPGYDNIELSNELKSRLGDEVVRCDSAEPKSIAELQRMGVYARPVSKAPGSVMHGLQWLTKFHTKVDVNSQGAINELSVYSWETDKKTGNPYNKPKDESNHFIDAWRYAFEPLMMQRRPMLIVSNEAKEIVKQIRERRGEEKSEIDKTDKSKQSGERKNKKPLLVV